ncbi:hypothetical protein ACFL04_04200 [Patescibacteria group bacterium]
MSKKKDVLAVSLRRFYSSADPGKIRKLARKIATFIRQQPMDEQGSTLMRLAKLISQTLKLDEAELEGYRERHIVLGKEVSRVFLEQANMLLINRNFLSQLQPKQASLETFSGEMILRSGFCHQIGSSLTETLRFCRLIFAEVAKIDEKESAELSTAELKASVSDNPNVAIIGFVFQSLAVAVDDGAPQKLWFTNLIEAAGKGNTEVDWYLESAQNIVAQFAVTQGRKSADVMAQKALDLQVKGATKSEKFRLFFVTDWSNPRIVVPDRLYARVCRLHQRRTEKTERDMRAAAEFRRWFLGNADTISEVFDRWCREIVEKRRSWIRPMGCDSFLVKVTPLTAVGITSFSLYREDEQVPNVKLSLAIRKSGGNILSRYWAYLRDFQLVADNIIFENWQDFEMAYLRSVLEVIIVDAIHRVVVRPKTKDLSGEKIEREKLPARRNYEKRVVVRPFIRRLPLGHKASDAAKELAFLEIGLVLPDDVTYVQSHDRWAGLPEGKPAPMFVYTDDAVKKSVTEWSTKTSTSAP